MCFDTEQKFFLCFSNAALLKVIFKLDLANPVQSQNFCGSYHETLWVCDSSAFNEVPDKHDLFRNL